MFIGVEVFPFGIVLGGGDAVFGEVGENQEDSAATLFQGGVGDADTRALHGGIFLEHAGEFAGGAALEFAAWGIGGVGVELGEFESQGVGDRDVPGNVREQDGIFGGDVIELPFIGKL